MGTKYPCSDHYPPHPEIFNKDFYFAVGNPIFGQIFGHQRAENEARNTKMYRGQGTYPIRVNAMYEMNFFIVFSKSSRNPIFGHIFGLQRAKNEARITKMNRGQETHPIRVNARYEINWANVFFKKFRKPCLQMDGLTLGWIQYPPIPPSVERGYNNMHKPENIKLDDKSVSSFNHHQHHHHYHHPPSTIYHLVYRIYLKHSAILWWVLFSQAL